METKALTPAILLPGTLWTNSLRVHCPHHLTFPSSGVTLPLVVYPPVPRHLQPEMPVRLRVLTCWLAAIKPEILAELRVSVCWLATLKPGFQACRNGDWKPIRSQNKLWKIGWGVAFTAPLLFAIFSPLCYTTNERSHNRSELWSRSRSKSRCLWSSTGVAHQPQLG